LNPRLTTPHGFNPVKDRFVPAAEKKTPFVQGLDFFDGTPILDIKGYRLQYRTENLNAAVLVSSAGG
jgi:tRNA (Thr-GGU) A37 N-methylase